MLHRIITRALLIAAMIVALNAVPADAAKSRCTRFFAEANTMLESMRGAFMTKGATLLGDAARQRSSARTVDLVRLAELGRDCPCKAQVTATLSQVSDVRDALLDTGWVTDVALANMTRMGEFQAAVDRLSNLLIAARDNPPTSRKCGRR